MQRLAVLGNDGQVGNVALSPVSVLCLERGWSRNGKGAQHGEDSEVRSVHGILPKFRASLLRTVFGHDAPRSARTTWWGRTRTDPRCQTAPVCRLIATV